MATINTLKQQLLERFGNEIAKTTSSNGELTIELPPKHLTSVCLALRDEPLFKFEMLIDICGVDYLDYGLAQWRTKETTAKGFDRGVENDNKVRVTKWHKPRFACVYQLLSLTHNHRLRVRVFVPQQSMTIDSVVAIWPAANWFEREAFDLFGILYQGHPDLRRILTDYGFIGHPFRKDFPLSGHVEVRYDAKVQQVIYEPVDIEPRVSVPKVIRYNDDNN